MNVTVSGSATARAYNVQGIQNGIAPITVNYKHPLLNCTRGQNPTCNPTFGTPTQLTLEDIHTSGGKDAAGAFGLINLNGVQSGNVGAGTLADWLTNGYHDHDLQVGKYDSVPGANFNNSTFTAALDQQIGHELLFPVYRLLEGAGIERDVRHHRLGRLRHRLVRRERQHRDDQRPLHPVHDRRSSS